MGQKQSSTANWSMNDWAFGTGENAAQLEDVVNEAKQAPAKYFGGQAIENDASMHQMQHELLSFDESLKRIFRRKKNKRPKNENYSNQYYQDQQGYDQSQYAIPEEDIRHLPPIYAAANQQTTDKDSNAHSSWRCTSCSTENKSTDIECRQCKESLTTF